MGRLLGIDFGHKRCGLAVTDSLKISINPLITVDTPGLVNYLQQYLKLEEVEKLLIGWPTHSDGRETLLVKEINTFLLTFAQLFPGIEIIKVDEAFSSSEAKELIFQSGVGKKQRRDKALLDKVSAVIIIKRYLDYL